MSPASQPGLLFESGFWELRSIRPTRFLIIYRKFVIIEPVIITGI
jgi:hypothetical protein